jgi:hypothetical protein
VRRKPEIWCPWCRNVGIEDSNKIELIPMKSGAGGAVSSPWDEGGLHCWCCGAQAPYSAWKSAQDWYNKS